MPKPLRVLVADDHAVHRTLLSHIFTALDCVVATVNDGLEAVAAREPYDIICLDRNMPGLDGAGAAAALRGRAFLVACTSDPVGLGNEFDAVVPKPVCVRHIAEVVARARKVSRSTRTTGHARAVPTAA